MSLLDPMPQNPLAEIITGINEIKHTLKVMQNKPNQELQNRKYTIKECGNILKLSYQTIRAHILKGNIKAEKVGRYYRVKHSVLMDCLDDVKSLKYKR